MLKNGVSLIFKKYYKKHFLTFFSLVFSFFFGFFDLFAFVLVEQQLVRKMPFYSLMAISLCYEPNKVRVVKRSIFLFKCSKRRRINNAF